MESFIQNKLNKHFIKSFKNLKFKLEGKGKEIGKIVGFNFSYNERDKVASISSVHFKPDIKKEGKMEVFNWISFSDLIPITKKYVKANINKEIFENEDFNDDLARTTISFPTIEFLERKKEIVKDKDIFIYMINEIEKDLFPESLDVIYVTDKEEFNEIEYLIEFPTKLINNIEEVRNTVFKKPSYKEITKMFHVFEKEYREYIEK